MGKINAKTNYIRALISAFNFSPNEDGVLGDNENYFTYFIPGLIITGKKCEIESLKAVDDDSLEEELVRKLSNGEGLNRFALAGKMDELLKKALSDGEDNDEDKVLILEDVTIQTVDRQVTYNTSHFILFADQILGIIPGEAE